MLSVGNRRLFQARSATSLPFHSPAQPPRRHRLSSDIRMNVGMTRAAAIASWCGIASRSAPTLFFMDLLAYVRRIGGYRTAWKSRQGRPAAFSK
jgi:3-mercaptopyruvate sulfurtransferase SseA